MTTTPPPGVYPGIPETEYRSWSAVNASSLKLLERSPAHYRFARDNPKSDDDTDALLVGRMAHMAMFQPDLMDEQVRVWTPPINPKTGKPYGPDTNAAALDRAAFTDMHRGKIIVAESQMAVASAVAAAARANPEIRALLELPGTPEVSIVWDDEDTGLRCQGRIDWLAKGLLLDLKTCEVASNRAVSAMAMRYGYFTQMAFYTDGLAQLYKRQHEAWIIAVEKEPPHGMGRYRVHELGIEWGRKAYKAALSVIAECEASGVWPGYADGELTPPESAIRELNDE